MIGERTVSALVQGLQEFRLELDRLVAEHARPDQKIRWLAEELALSESNLERLGVPAHLQADVAEATRAAHAGLALIARVL